MKLGRTSGSIKSFSAIIALTILTGLVGLGLVFSSVAADKEKLDVGAGISGQAGIGKSAVGENASASAKVSAQVGANVSSSSSSSPGQRSQEESHESTQATSNEVESHGHFRSSYEKIYANSDATFTVQTDRHLYKPGDQVEMEGTIWPGLIATVGSINTVSIQVKDNDGNQVYKGSSQVNSNGEYSTTFQLPSDAKNGAYTVQTTADVSADVLGTLSLKTQASLSGATKFIVISPNAWAVKAEGQDFDLNIATNSSSVNDLKFDEQGKKLSFTVQGETGTKGVLDVDIPKSLLNGDLTVMMDGQAMSQNDIVETDAQDHTTLELNYHHSTHEIDIVGTNVVPEFSISLVVLLIAISSTVLFYRIRPIKSSLI